MRKNVIGLTLSFLLFALSVAADAQQLEKVPRVGYLTGTREPTVEAPDANRDAFRQGLREFGYVEGKNILVEYRYAGGRPDRVPSLVRELVQLKVGKG